MTTSQPPSADVVFDTLFAYQRSAALKAALDLDLFSVIDDGANTAAAAATRCGASERGIRILCDYLTTLDLLEKSGSTYQLPPTSAAFLSQRSPMYMGSTARFLLMPGVKNNFDDLTGAVQRGGVAPAGNTVAPENPIWVEFARAMVPMMVPAAHGIADALRIESAGPTRVLDIAASHGIFGITLALRNPKVEVTAVDWASVLEVAKENAAAARCQRAHPHAARRRVRSGVRCGLRRGTRHQLPAPLRSPNVHLVPRESAPGAQDGRPRGHSGNGPQSGSGDAPRPRPVQPHDAGRDALGRRLHARRAAGSARESRLCRRVVASVADAGNGHRRARDLRSGASFSNATNAVSAAMTATFITPPTIPMRTSSNPLRAIRRRRYLFRRLT